MKMMKTMMILREKTWKMMRKFPLMKTNKSFRRVLLNSNKPLQSNNQRRKRPSLNNSRRKHNPLNNKQRKIVKKMRTMMMTLTIS